MESERGLCGRLPGGHSHRRLQRLLHGRAGNVHLCGTLLVGLLLQVNQPNDLILVQRQQDRLTIPTSVGTECIDLWCATNPTAPWRSWHGHASFVFGIYRLYSKKTANSSRIIKMSNYVFCLFLLQIPIKKRFSIEANWARTPFSLTAISGRSM